MYSPLKKKTVDVTLTVSEVASSSFQVGQSLNPVNGIWTYFPGGEFMHKTVFTYLFWLRVEIFNLQRIIGCNFDAPSKLHPHNMG